MKMFVQPSEIYLHRDFVDFRKAINGLAALVEDELNRDAYTGALFVFCNKSKDKLKYCTGTKRALPCGKSA